MANTGAARGFRSPLDSPAPGLVYCANMMPQADKGTRQLIVTLRPPTADILKGNGSVDDTNRPAIGTITRTEQYDPRADAVLFHGRCEDLMKTIPDGSVQLAITSPPYNIGKSYETRSTLEACIERQRQVIAEVTRRFGWRKYLLAGRQSRLQRRSLPARGGVYPIFKSLGLHMRNRIVWHYEHGLHASRRFSGRYEVICWYTKGDVAHYFDFDELRVPQKYPNKRYFRGPQSESFPAIRMGRTLEMSGSYRTSSGTTWKRRYTRASSLLSW